MREHEGCHKAIQGTRLMPVLTAVIAAGGFLTLPLAGNGAIQAIMSQPMRLEIQYEGIEPVPVLGRVKTASASLVADLSPQSYKIVAHARSKGVMTGSPNTTSPSSPPA